MHLKIHKVLLTDSSAVYDVVMHGTGDGQIYQIPCYTQDDAEALLRGFAKLLEDHTLEAVTITDEKPEDDRCRPHATFNTIRADEVAECWDGVGTELYATLWNKIVPLQKEIPNIEDSGPHDHIGYESLAAHWHVLSLADQIELNALAQSEERRRFFDSE